MRPEVTSQAAIVAGCLVDRALDDRGVPRVDVTCPSGWAAARFLVALARADAFVDPIAVAIASKLRARVYDDDGFARALHAFVLREIRFARERGEIFQAPEVTVRTRIGDCDCHARLIYAVLTAGSVPARMVFLHRGRKPLHVVVQAFVAGAWRWLETTIKKGGGARFDEHPIDAAKRAGVIRRDVGGKMAEVVMGGAIGVEGGTVYRMRVGVLAPRDAASEGAIEAGLLQLGFTDVTVWTSRDALPADFPPNARDEMPEAAWTAYAEALYARPESRMLEMPIEVPADVREGVIGLVLDDLTAVRSTVEPTTEVRIKPTTIAGVVPISLTKHLSSAFFRRVEETAARFRSRGANVRAEDFLNVWLYESGVNPRRRGNPPHVDFYGLNMMQGSLLPNVGFHGGGEAYLTLPGEEQVRYVERFYELNVRAFLKGEWSGLSSATALYLMNFLPAYTKHVSDPSYVLARRGDRNGWYEANLSFDVGRKGWIEVADLTKALDRARSGNSAYWKELVARQQTEGGTSSGWGPVVALVPWLALAGSIVYTIRNA